MRHFTTPVAACVAALVTVTGTSHAGDDGGTRSVFADGAGNRALALGGAYVAIADDASAAVWNPGGLGFVNRREVQASHTNLFGLGFSEQFASLVLPSWRFGAASLTLRSFGVGDIDARDARNSELATDLSAREMEIALGFGRRIDDYWGIGGAVKLQHQRVGEASDLGLGIDLGAKSYLLAALGYSSVLADRLSFGLSVRNALQPRQRLAEDSVADPSVFRFGLGYAMPIDGARTLTWALDVDTSGGVSPRLHTGVELQAVQALALRAGFDGGRLRAGVGTNLGDMGLDYAFEDHALGSVHRVGLRYAFGKSVEESREAYFLAEEAALQDRLAAAFEERTRARIEQLIVSIESDLAAGRTADALESIGILKVLDPDEPHLARMEAHALFVTGLEEERRGDVAAALVSLRRASTLAPDHRETIEALARVSEKLASQTARSNEARELMRAALDALAGDDLGRARQGFRAVLAVAPEDTEARRMLARTEQAIERRVASLLEQASTLGEAGLFAEARSALDGADALRPEDPRIAATRATLLAAENARSKSTTPPAAPEPVATAQGTPPGDSPQASEPRRRPLSPEEREQVVNLYRLGVEAAGEGRIEDAIRYWEFVWSSDPEHADVAENLKREYLARGMEAFASGRLDDAVAEWNNVLRIDPEDERAEGYLRRAREQENRFREILQDSRVAEDDE